MTHTAPNPTYDGLNKSESALVTLAEDGPQPLEINPKARIRRRHPNLRRVILSAGRHSGFNLGTIEPVWYLKGEHDPVEVVRAVIDANPQIVDPSHEKATITQKFGNHSPELRQAWREISNEFDVASQRGGNTAGGQLGMDECPLGCGEAISDIRAHLDDCPANE